MPALAVVAAANAAAPRRDGQQALVLGGTSGIGMGVAVRLAAAGMNVAIVGRNAARAEAALRQLREAGPAGGVYEFISVDLFDLGAARELCSTFRANHPRLDVLSLSQGRGMTNSGDNVRKKLNINYFSRILVARELAPLLAAAPDPRILSVLSAGVHSPYAHWEDDFELRSHRGMKATADAAGFYNDLGFDALSRAFPSVTCAHAAPGFVDTNWGSEFPACLACCFACMARTCGAPVDSCAEFMAHPLLAESFKGGGFHTLGPKAGRVAKTAQHAAAIDGVWARTGRVLDRGPAPQTA